jgi:hypothetical protein
VRLVDDDQLRAEAERLLWRYVVEVVERFGLCPWARRARERGEVRVEVLTGAPTQADVEAAVARIAASPGAVMGMVVLPRATLDERELRRLRADVLAAPCAGGLAIAEFHPAAARDDSTAARVVPWLRRSPDPTLQVVRLATLAGLRDAADAPPLVTQAAMLAGLAPAPPPSVSDQIAETNHATVRGDGPQLQATVAAIHADRDATYARLAAR